MRMVLLNTEMFFLVKLTVLLPGVTQNWGWFDRSTKPHLRYAKFWCRFSIMRSYFVRTFRKFFLNHKLVRSSSLFCRYMRLINCLDGYFDWEWHTVVVLLSMLFSSDLWNKRKAYHLWKPNRICVRPEVYSIAYPYLITDVVLAFLFVQYIPLDRIDRFRMRWLWDLWSEHLRRTR